MDVSDHLMKDIVEYLSTYRNVSVLHSDWEHAGAQIIMACMSLAHAECMVGLKKKGGGGFLPRLK